MKKILSILLAAIAVLSSVAFCFGHDAPTTATAKTKLGITSIDELDGKTLAVQTEVGYETLLAKRLPNVEWLYYKMPNDMIFAMETNKVSAYLVEEVGFVAQYAQHPELVAIDELAGSVDFAIVIGKNENENKYLLEMNQFIKDSKENGFLDDLYDYWVLNFDADTSVIRNIPQTTGENGTVSIAIEGGYEPFSFESNGSFSGFDVEFMMNFCAKYGYTWDFKSVTFDAISSGAEIGKYDFGMNIVVSDERTETAALSDPYYSCNVVLVLEGETEESKGFIASIKDNFYKTFIKEDRWKLFVDGTITTTLITLASILFGTLLGFITYMACRHGNKIANAIADFFTWLIDGMPTVLLLMILYYIVFANTALTGSIISVVGFALIFGCSMYDMLCVGCGAVAKGQTEASLALGYTDRKSFYKIILPQAAKHFLPIYRNEIVTLIKETSVVGYIAVLDLTKMSDLVRSRTYEAFFPLIATAIIYFVISGIMVAIVKRVEISIDPKHRDKNNILAGIKEWE